MFINVHDESTDNQQTMSKYFIDIEIFFFNLRNL